MKKETLNNEITADNIFVGKLFSGEENKQLHDKEWRLSKGQRMYSWSKEQINQLLEDIQYVQDNNINNYLLQSITISEDLDEVKVLDGQQRLTTLYLIKLAIAIVRYKKYAYDKINNSNNKKNNENYKVNNEVDRIEKIKQILNDLQDYYSFLKKQNIEVNNEVLDILSLNADHFEKDTNLELIENCEKSIDDILNRFNMSFKESVNKNKIKLNIFLEDHKSNIYELFNSKIYNFVSKIADAFLDDKSYKNTINDLCSDSLNDIKFEYSNCNKYTYNIFENLKIILLYLWNNIEQDENYLEYFENTLNNKLSINLTNLGEVNNQQEIKNFVNINSRGLKLDFSDQYKSWYLSKVLENIKNKDIQEKVFKNIDLFFDKVYKEYDIVKNGEDINLINDSLIHTINFYGHFTKHLDSRNNTDSNSEDDIETDIKGFFTLSTKEINTAWYSFQHMISISENCWNNTECKEKYFGNSELGKINIYEKLISEINECTDNDLPLFLKFWNKIIKGLKIYWEKIATENKNWYETSHQSRLLPYISLVLSNDVNEEITEQVLKDSVTAINSMSVILTLKGNWTNNMSKMDFIVKKVWDQFDKYTITWIDNDNVILDSKTKNVKTNIKCQQKLENIELFLTPQVVKFFIEKSKEQICYSWHTVISEYSNKCKYNKPGISNLNYQRFLYVLGNFQDKKLIENKFNIHHQIPQVLFKDTKSDQNKLNENYISNYFDNKSIIESLITDNSNPLIFTQLVEESWNKSWKHGTYLIRNSNQNEINLNIEYYFGEYLYFATQNDKPNEIEFKLKDNIEENSVIYSFKKIYDSIEQIVHNKVSIDILRSEDIDTNIKNIKNYKINKYLQLRNQLKNNWKY